MTCISRANAEYQSRKVFKCGMEDLRTFNIIQNGVMSGLGEFTKNLKLHKRNVTDIRFMFIV